MGNKITGIRQNVYRDGFPFFEKGRLSTEESLGQRFPLRIQPLQLLLDAGLFRGELLEPGHLGADGWVGQQAVDFPAPVLQGGDFLLAFLQGVLLLAYPGLFLLFGDPVLLRVGPNTLL